MWYWPWRWCFWGYHGSSLKPVFSDYTNTPTLIGRPIRAYVKPTCCRCKHACYCYWCGSFRRCHCQPVQDLLWSYTFFFFRKYTFFFLQKCGHIKLNSTRLEFCYLNNHLYDKLWEYNKFTKSIDHWKKKSNREKKLKYNIHIKDKIIKK